MAQKIRGITIDLGVDTSKLTKGLKDANSSLRSTQTELKDVNKLLKLDPKNTTLLKQKTELLNDAIGKTKDKLSEQKKLMEELKKAGDTTDNRKQQQALERDIEATKNQLKDLEKQAKNTPSAFSASMQEFGGKMESVGGKMETFGSKMMGITTAIAGVAAASVAAFNDVDEAYDTVIAKTGATGTELEGMEDIVNNIAGKMPADFDEIGDAVGDVSTRFKLSGDELENVSTAFLQFSKLNGTSVSTSIASVQKAMAAFGVSTDDTVEFLDYLNYVGQQTGVSMDSLASSMTSNAASFQEMGLSAEQSAMFLGQLEVSGVDASAVLSGLKKALANATAEGKTLPDALAEIQDEMTNANSSTEGLQASFELFGNKAGGAIYNACKNGQLDFKKLGKQAEKSMTTVDGTFESTIDATDKAKIAFNKMKVAGSKLGEKLLEKLTPVIEKVTEWIDKLTKKWDKLDDTQKNNIIRIAGIVAAIGPLVAGIGKVVSIAGTLMAHPIMAAIAGAAALIGVITLAIKNARDEVDDFAYASSDLHSQVTEDYEEYQQKVGDRSEEMGAIDTEIGKIEELKKQYNLLVGEKGEIAEKDKPRAEFIKTELAKALGIEKEKIDDLIEANGLLGDSIDEVIKKKKTQLILESMDDDYGDAVTNIDAKEKEYKELNKKYEKAGKDYEKITKEIEDYAKKHHGGNMDFDMWTLFGSDEDKEMARKFKTAKSDYYTLKDDVAKVQEEYLGYQEIVATYEGLSTASLSDNAVEVEYWTQRISRGFQTSSSASVDALHSQTVGLVEEYKKQKAALEAGSTDVTQTEVDAIKKMIEAAATEEAKAKGLGQGFIDMVMSGIDENSELLYVDAKKTGGKIVDSTKEGINNNQSGLYATGEQGGKDYGDGLINGMTAKQRAVYEKARELGMNVRTAQMEALDEHSPSKVAMWVGKMYGAGLVKGLHASINPVSNMANRLAAVTSTPLASGSTTSNTVNNSPTIVVNAAAGQSASSIADAVIARLNNSYRQATKTFA